MTNKSKRYIVMPIELIVSKDLTDKEKYILMEIQQLTMLDKGCIATNRHFAELFEMPKTNVSRAINSLEKKGYIQLDNSNIKRNNGRVIKLIFKGYQIDIKQYQNGNSLKGIKQIHKESNNPLVEEFYNYFNAEVDILPIAKCIKLTDKRKQKISTRFQEPLFRDNWKDIIDKISESDHLQGINDRGWKVTLDWIVENETNYIKILEDKYKSKML